jgi:hypothetical protein
LLRAEERVTRTLREIQLLVAHKLVVVVEQIGLVVVVVVLEHAALFPIQHILLLSKMVAGITTVMVSQNKKTLALETALLVVAVLIGMIVIL